MGLPSLDLPQLQAEFERLRAENELLKEELYMYHASKHLLLLLLAFGIFISLSVVIALRREVFQLWRQFDDTLALKSTDWNARSMRMHDIFNLLVLPVVVFLDIWFVAHGDLDKSDNPNFWGFLWFTVAYIGIDMLWVTVFPKCVKSQATILVHHAVTLFYLAIPMYNPLTRYAMAICLTVELNTWFLIMRRSPLMKLSQICASVVKACFYVTWYTIRIGLYPYMVYDVYQLFVSHVNGLKARGDPSWERASYGLTYMVIPVIFQSTLTLLNIHWTIQLTRNTRAGKAPEKGL